MTIKRQLHCNNPDCPHERLLYFNDWVRENLPAGDEGFMVSDIDFILADFISKKIILLELKNYGKSVKPRQHELFKNINSWINKSVNNGWEYLGFHLIEFEKNTFDNGSVYYDNKLSSEKEIKRILSFENWIQ